MCQNRSNLIINILSLTERRHKLNSIIIKNFPQYIVSWVNKRKHPGVLLERTCWTVHDVVFVIEQQDVGTSESL
jgi:hypothetical protein